MYLCMFWGLLNVVYLWPEIFIPVRENEGFYS